MSSDAAIVLGARGMLGYNLEYWRRVQGLRPDVRLLREPGTPPAGAPVFTALALENGRVGRGIAWAVPRGALPRDAWFVPVLAGGRNGLVLYRVEREPPASLVPDHPPAHPVERRFDDATLIGYTLHTVADAPTPRVRLGAWWRPGAGRPPVVSTRVDDLTLEAHELGRGNWARYVAASMIAGPAPVRIASTTLRIAVAVATTSFPSTAT